MAVALRTPGEIDAIAEAGRITAELIEQAFTELRVGDTTLGVADRMRDRLAETDAEPAMLGFDDAGRRPSFPHVASVSVNEDLPGTPPGRRVIEDGDLVSIDLVLRLGRWHADAATARLVTDDGLELPGDVQSTIDVVFETAAAFEAGGLFIERAFRERFAALGLSLAPGPVGHGIGRNVHEAPHLAGDRGVRLARGMVFTVEPIVCEGRWPGHVAGGDGWTARAAGGARVWTEERTFAITENGPRNLTPFSTDRKYGI